MIGETDFEAMAADIAALNGIPLDLAREYAFWIGDVIELAEDGLVVVRDDAGRELARVRLDEQTPSGVPPIPAKRQSAR